MQHFSYQIRGESAVQKLKQLFIRIFLVRRFAQPFDERIEVAPKKWSS